jgi:hypothetical protein
VGDAPDPEVEAVDPGDPINDEKEVNEDEDELLEHAFGELDIDVPLQGDDTPVAEPEYEPPFDEDDGDGNGDDGIGDLGGSAASGGASSSGAPPPPAPEASMPRHYGGRRAGEVSVVLTGYGKITYYSNGNYFEAVCGQKHHARCVAKRMAASNVRIPWQGRPCGFLAAWLVMGASIPLKAEHAKHKPTLDSRLCVQTPRGLRTAWRSWQTQGGLQCQRSNGIDGSWRMCMQISSAFLWILRPCAFVGHLPLPYISHTVHTCQVLQVVHRSFTLYMT